MGRGKLRVYLGAAPGVGKTFAMLNEGRRRRERGTDAVVAFVETHGRARTAEAVAGLEILPRRTIAYRGTTFTEMDVDAVLARHPEVALIDELAHTNVPGSRHEKRWQDVEELLAAGIEVISTVNIQHLESLNDVVEKITGVPQRETIPDDVVRRADQIELVDMSPEALRRRMAHGNIYAAEKTDAALSNYFRVGNLTALRELALLWLADKVDEQLDRYRAEHGITATWEARERVVVALTGGPEGETLVRRAARIAARAHGGDLLAVHVTSSDGLAGTDPQALARQRVLVESLGGSYHTVVGDSVPVALLDYARAENSTQLVLGASRRGRLATFLTGPGIGAAVTRLSGDIDVHMVSHEHAASGGGLVLPSLGGGLTPARRLAGAVMAVVALPVLTLALVGLRPALTLPSQILLYLLTVVAVAFVGGVYPALAAAVAGSLLLNYFFVPPLHTFTIAEPNNVLALVVFLTVGAAVSSVVDLAARRTRQAARLSREAVILSTAAGSVLRGETALPALLDRVRSTFAMSGVTLLERRAEHPEDHWEVVASAGVGCHHRRRRRRGRGRRRGPGPSASRPTAACRGRARAHRVRRAGGRGAGAPAAGGGGGGGGATGRGRPVPDGAAGRRQPRPAHAAGFGQGRRQQPAQHRGALDHRGTRRTAGHRRRVAGQARPAGGEPVGHEPAAGRRAQRLPPRGGPG